MRWRNRHWPELRMGLAGLVLTRRLARRRRARRVGRDFGYAYRPRLVPRPPFRLRQRCRYPDDSLRWVRVSLATKAARSRWYARRHHGRSCDYDEVLAFAPGWRR